MTCPREIDPAELKHICWVGNSRAMVQPPSLRGALATKQSSSCRACGFLDCRVASLRGKPIGFP
ncbi:hypothetical protein FNL55_00925 [Tardiphaga sp. vice352]|nr:hypothetical protein FNL53_00930 [Tardiphaga sp. vice278]QDM19837.1 hypothetical protein FIU28_00730 [Tardiphaga sp. vice154]QDM24857.1 hypothetical protein FNL56_00830 [Tardiphaga sp. vice304]QDM30067.1 hypothetical protein FNL55_00925 [Tardiphaga sp. vice352]